MNRTTVSGDFWNLKCFKNLLDDDFRILEHCLSETKLFSRNSFRSPAQPEWTFSVFYLVLLSIKLISLHFAASRIPLPMSIWSPGNGCYQARWARHGEHKKTEEILPKSGIQQFRLILKERNFGYLEARNEASLNILPLKRTTKSRSQSLKKSGKIQNIKEQQQFRVVKNLTVSVSKINRLLRAQSLCRRR